MDYEDNQYPRPLGESVLLQHLKRDDGDRMIGSIYVPPTSETQKEPERFLVLAVGPGRLDSKGKWVPVQVKKDDIVVVGHPGTELHYDGETYYVANQNNIIAVLPE